MKKIFGQLATGETAHLYVLTSGGYTAEVTDLGAALVRMLCPDAQGQLADVVLGYDTPEAYRTGTLFLGATVGRSANRICGAAFPLNGKQITLNANENGNSLHSGPDFYHARLWETKSHDDTAVTFCLHSPSGDQGFPGNADIEVTYRLDNEGGLHISYAAVSDQDTVFNLTNHSYFNMAGHQHTEQAVAQLLMLPGRHFLPDNAQNIPTGELRSVSGTPMDFRAPKVISQDIGADYEPLHLQGGYDHTWEVFCTPCAVLTDPVSGRWVSVSTDMPGIQFYAGNFVDGTGKDGVYYGKRSGIALETQFYPDSVNHPEWKQPFVKAGVPFRSETVYRFGY